MQIEIDQNKNIARVIIKGPIDAQGIIEAFNSTVLHDEYQFKMGRLWDFRETDLSQLDMDSVRELAGHSSRFPDGVNDVKVAFVAKRDLELGLTRLFQTFASLMSQTEVKIFTEITEAEDWLTEALN